MDGLDSPSYNYDWYAMQQEPNTVGWYDDAADCEAKKEGKEQGKEEAHRPRRLLGALLLSSLIWVGPILACGSFQPRPTPPPTPVVTELAIQPEETTNAPTATDTPHIIEPTATPTAAPTPTFTPTPEPGTALAVDQPARVVAPGGLNLRSSASTSGEILVRLGVGEVITVLEGPESADEFTWWRVDDGEGNVGWAAQGDGDVDFLSPDVGESQPVNRAPRVGDRVQVTVETGQLTVRAMPGTNSSIVARVDVGNQFTVIGGPQSADGYIWYQIRSDDDQVTGWAADGNDDTRWLSPLE